MSVSFVKKESDLHDMVDVREHGEHTLGLAKFGSMQEYMEFYKNIPDDDEAVMGKRGTFGTSDSDNENESRQRFIFGAKSTYGSSVKVKPLRTIDGIFDSAMNGYCHNVFAKTIDKYRDKINSDNIGALQDEVKSIKRVRRFTEDGAELDIDRVMCGDNEYWQTTRRDGQYRVVRLVINYSMSYQNKAEDFMKVLAMAYVMAELVERLGYGVEIYAMSCSRPFGYLSEQGILIPLKLAQEGLDVERIGVVGIVGFFRHFDWIVLNKLFGYFNGRCHGVTKDMRAFAGADILIENSWIHGNQQYKITKALDGLREEE